AIDPLAGLFIIHLQSSRVGLCRIPLGEAVATEAGQIHEVDILHLLVLVEVFEQTPKRSCFKFDLIPFTDIHTIFRSLGSACFHAILTFRASPLSGLPRSSYTTT